MRLFLLLLFTWVRKYSAIDIIDFKDAAECTEACVRTRSKLIPTKMPLIVQEKVFQGASCPKYEDGFVKNCSNLYSPEITIEVGSKTYAIEKTPRTWFAAQKFCHSNGWQLGELTNEKLLQPLLVGSIGSADVWSAANTFASKGSAFAFTESNLSFSDVTVKADKNFMDKGCLMLSGWTTANIIKKAEACLKEAQFLCQKSSPCILTKAVCENTYNKPCIYSAQARESCQDCISSIYCSTVFKKASSTFDYTGSLPFGVVKSICGKVYLFARDYLPLKLATDFCCSLGMKLASVETKHDLTCFAESKVKDIGTRWWTSGMKSDCSGKTAWCGSGQLYSEKEHGPLLAASSDKKCIVLTRISGGFTFSLAAANCSENNRPLCEGTKNPRRIYMHHNCPTIKCRVNMDVFPMKSEVTAIVYPPGGTMINQHNRQFFVSKSESTWFGAQAMCCSLEMTLFEASDRDVSLNDLIEISNLRNVRDNDQKKLIWTSGYRNGREDFFWCPRGTKVTGNVVGNDVNCLSLNAASRKLEATSCDIKMHYACEYIAMNDEMCVAGTCPYIGSPEEVKLKSKTELSSLASKGKIHYDVCGRHFFISNEGLPFTQSIKFCFQNGMRPVMFDTKEGMRCFLKFINYYEGGNTGIAIFLPISDENCKGRFAWCGTGEVVTPELFNMLKPTAFRSDETYNHCIHTWIYFKNKPTGHFHKQACDFAIDGNVISKIFMCDIPA